MRLRSPFRPSALTLIGGALLALLAPTAVQAMGAAPAPSPSPAPRPFHGKRLLGLAKVPDTRIELPNQDIRNFGGDFQARITTLLMDTGKYLISDVPKDPARFPGIYPSATLSFKVDAFSFQTGERGERAFYGFNERFSTPFNDGTGARANEFPLRTERGTPAWFGKSFDRQGFIPFDSQSGLDLGDGFELNAIFAYLDLKYARYHSELHLTLTVDAPTVGKLETKKLLVSGEGFFFDIAGGYLLQSAGIRLARADAMARAFEEAVSGSLSLIEKEVADLPLTTRVLSLLEDGQVMLATPPAAELVAGTVFESADPAHAGVRIELVSEISGGAIGRVLAGTPQAGLRLREEGFAPPASLIAGLGQALRGGAQEPSLERLQLPWKNLGPIDLKGLAPLIDPILAYARSVAETATLPYRIWRYYHYDQPYNAVADGNETTPVGSPDSSRDQSPFPPRPPRTPVTWAEKAHAEGYAKQIGLASLPAHPAVSPEIRSVVAVLDSGVDYNHWALHDALWKNPAPRTDESGLTDEYGWDFASHDPRPYDDGYHGTQVASLVLAVAPNARILPLKIFNPWGITSSAALYAAFRYAVDHGARIIVCGWSTMVNSEAIEQGVAYAREHGVAVVAAAGDEGLNLDQTPRYPVSLARAYDNVFTVAATGASALWQAGETVGSNYGPATVAFSAPGEAILAAKPRKEFARESSTAWAAALTAGALARNLSVRTRYGHEESYREWFEELKTEAKADPALAAQVAGGSRLWLRK